MAEAKQLYSDILSREPKHVVALHHLGVIEYQEGDARTAIALIGKAIALRPDYAEAYSNLGNALKELGKLEDAVTAYRKAVGLKPDYSAAHYNLGSVLHDLGKRDEAEAAYRGALKLNPDHAETHMSLGLLLLLTGNFEEGCSSYEWRRQTKGLLSESPRYSRMLWTGDTLDNATILLHAEQGVGDSLQFVRYAPLVAARGGNVVIECGREVARLVATVGGVKAVTLRGVRHQNIWDH